MTMTKPVFDKEKIPEIVDFMMTPYACHVYYQFIEISDDRYTIKYFSLRPDDEKKLNQLIQLKFGNY